MLLLASCCGGNRVLDDERAVRTGLRVLLDRAEVCVRFATKADLLKRVIGVAVVGDTQQIDLAHRDWVVTTMTAPTLHERLVADAAGTTALFVRLAPIIAVVLQVEPDDR